MFMPRVTYQDYEKIVMRAVEAGYNTIRVWGGGNYENEAFYELCDKHGIFLWHDFMFANTMFPGDQAFQTNVE